jgi:hypothetical protein
MKNSSTVIPFQVNMYNFDCILKTVELIRDTNTSCWCVNLPKKSLNKLNIYSDVYDCKLNAPDDFLNNITKNLFFKHLNVCIQYYDSIQINNKIELYKNFKMQDILLKIEKDFICNNNIFLSNKDVIFFLEERLSFYELV